MSGILFLNILYFSLTGVLSSTLNPGLRHRPQFHDREKTLIRAGDV